MSDFKRFYTTGVIDAASITTSYALIVNSPKDARSAIIDNNSNKNLLLSFGTGDDDFTLLAGRVVIIDFSILDRRLKGQVSVKLAVAGAATGTFCVNMFFKEHI